MGVVSGSREGIKKHGELRTDQVKTFVSSPNFFQYFKSLRHLSLDLFEDITCYRTDSVFFAVFCLMDRCVLTDVRYLSLLLYIRADQCAITNTKKTIAAPYILRWRTCLLCALLPPRLCYQISSSPKRSRLTHAFARAIHCANLLTML